MSATQVQDSAESVSQEVLPPDTRYVVFNVQMAIREDDMDTDELAHAKGDPVFAPELGWIAIDPQFYRRQTGSIPDVKDILPIIRMPTFQWRAPVWVNMQGEPDMDVPTVMKRADDAVRCLYALLVQTGVHAMIEWYGVMVEHFRMLEYAVGKGIDPRSVDQHSGEAVEVPDFMVAYMCEKLGCQLKPFIRGSAEVWLKAIEEWFAGTSAASRQPERTTTFLLSSGRECQELMNWLFESSQWFAVDPLPNDQWEVTVKSELAERVARMLSNVVMY